MSEEINLQDFVARQCDWMVTFRQELDFTDPLYKGMFRAAYRIERVESQLRDAARNMAQVADGITNALAMGMSLNPCYRTLTSDHVSTLADQRNELYQDLAGYLTAAGWTVA